ncbi:MAG: acetyl-CoA hydrolase/transferase C-terminal domain-containing protein [Methylophilaceae bacterium]
MEYEEELKQKICTADDAASLVNSGDVIDYGFGLTQSDVFDEALAAQRERLSNVTVRGTMSVSAKQVIELDPDQQHFEYHNWHCSGYDRKKCELGQMSYMPFNFGEGPGIYCTHLHADVLVLKTSPMDENGYFNFGISNTFAKANCEVAKKIVIETSTAIPVCLGSDNTVHISDVTAVIEGDNAPLFELPSGDITDIDRQVAAHVLPLIKDRSCIQIGIGGMPNAVCAALTESDIKDLGIHTEMFVDSMVPLIEAGKVTGKYKQTYPEQITYTFALGSKKMYDFLDNNDTCVSIPVDVTNLPDNISANDRVVSINNCLQIDLSGQVASESSGYRHISGTGGQLQFVRGAVASKEGQSFMCLSSRFYDKSGKGISRIVPGLSPGTVVTTPRTDVMYVVTEYGIVNLKGKSVSERALALISISHPDDREELHKQACENGILTKKYWS